MRAALGAVDAAFAFLTVVPLRGAGGDETRLARAAAYFPAVGAVMGLFVAAIDVVLSVALPLPVASVLDILFLAVLSGGLHLDGVADSADGLFVAGTREQRLAVMSDSRTGAFGVAAVVLVLLLETAALSSLGPAFRAPTLIAAGALSRWSMTAVLAWFPSAKTDGLAASFKRGLRPRHLLLATLLAVAFAAAAVRVDALASFVLATAIVILCGALARARIGGVSGDICGGVGELVFAGELVLASALYR